MPTAESDICTLSSLPPSGSTSDYSTTRWGSFRRAAKLWLLTLGSYWLVLFIATHVPAPRLIVGEFISHDKLLHAGAYFILATLLFITSRRTGVTTTFAVRASFVVLALAYGAFDELTQPYVGRSCSLFDWLADGVGIGLAVVLDMWRHPRQK